jgi:DNA-binding response OmpR family regulator
VKHRILVVDDDPLLTEASSILLSLDGHECRVANDGRTAIEEARRFDPDIVIIDICMKGMTGYDVARALRAESSTVHLAAVTGQDELLSGGFDQHVVKPIDGGALKRIVATAERMSLASRRDTPGE